MCYLLRCPQLSKYARALVSHSQSLPPDSAVPPAVKSLHRVSRAHMDSQWVVRSELRWKWLAVRHLDCFRGTPWVDPNNSIRRNTHSIPGPGHLCISQSSLCPAVASPDPVMRSEWSRSAQAGVCREAVMKIPGATASDLSLPCLGAKPAHLCSSWVEPTLPTVLLLVPVILLPVNGACLSWASLSWVGT